MQLAIVSYIIFDTKITTGNSILELTAHIVLIIIVNFSKNRNDNQNTWRNKKGKYVNAYVYFIPQNFRYLMFGSLSQSRT